MKKTIFTLLITACSLFINAQTGNRASLAIDANNGNRYGWAINYTTQTEANNSALKECEKSGGDCHIVLKFEGGCGVYVVDKNKPHIYAWAVAETKEEAEQKARNEALAKGATSLIVRVWGCNGTPLKSVNHDAPSTKGIYAFYFIQSQKDKKAFISSIVYYKNVAKKQGEDWEYTSDAQQTMTPNAKIFLDAVEENLYGMYSKEIRENHIKRGKLNWQGVNEVNKTATLDLDSQTERKEKVVALKNVIIKKIKEMGYTLIPVSL